MVSTSVIKRLAEEVDAMEDRFNQRGRPVVFLRSKDGLDKEAVLARHYQLFPEDRHPQLVVWTIYEGEDWHEPTADEPSWIQKSNRAWREIAREQRRNHDHA